MQRAEFRDLTACEKPGRFVRNKFVWDDEIYPTVFEICPAPKYRNPPNSP